MVEPMTGTVANAEFVDDDDADGRVPGTYITIRLDGDPRIGAGRVSITYLDEKSR